VTGARGETRISGFKSPCSQFPFSQKRARNRSLGSRSQQVNRPSASQSHVDVEFILVPYDLGHPNVGGGAGPERLMKAGARRVMTDAGHRVRSVQRIRLTRDAGNEVGNTFSIAGSLSRQVRTVRKEGRIPIVLGGSCSSGIGVMSGLTPEGPTGLVWFDAHGDANTPETSESGYLDGMPLAVILGWCWAEMARRVPGFVPVPEERVLHVGGRDFDPMERERLYGSRIGVLDAQRLRRRGGRTSMANALRPFADRALGVDLHIDLDVIDKGDGTANRFAAPGGPPLEEIEAAIRLVGDSCEVRAITLASYAPDLDGDHRASRAALRLLRAVARTLRQ
jgi:arginase